MKPVASDQTRVCVIFKKNKPGRGAHHTMMHVREGAEATRDGGGDGGGRR